MHMVWITYPKGYDLCTGFGLIYDSNLWITSTCGVDNFRQGGSGLEGHFDVQGLLIAWTFVDNVDNVDARFKLVADEVSA